MKNLSIRLEKLEQQNPQWSKWPLLIFQEPDETADEFQRRIDAANAENGPGHPVAGLWPL